MAQQPTLDPNTYYKLYNVNMALGCGDCIDISTNDPRFDWGAVGPQGNEGSIEWRLIKGPQSDALEAEFGLPAFLIQHETSSCDEAPLCIADAEVVTMEQCNDPTSWYWSGQDPKISIGSSSP